MRRRAQTTNALMPVAFQAPTLLYNSKARQSAPRCARRLRASTEAPKPAPRPARKSNPAAQLKGASHARRVKPLPKNHLLNRPEAVLSVFAIGLLATFSFLAKTGRRIANDVSARAKAIALSNVEQRRYAARLREKEFLESAVEATRATLSNTEHFLEKQTRRAEVAEETLSKLVADWEEVDGTTRRAAELRVALREQEEALAEERERTVVDATETERLNADVERRRSELANLEDELALAQSKLTDAQNIASENLQSALKEKEHLEVLLEQKSAQLEEELCARDQFVAHISEKQRGIEQASAVFNEVMSDIEQRRNTIEAIEKQAEEVGKLASKKRQALQAVIARDVQVEDKQRALERVRGKHQALKEHLESTRFTPVQKGSTRVDLIREVETREEEIREMKAKLDAVRMGSKITQKNSSSYAHPVKPGPQQNAGLAGESSIEDGAWDGIISFLDKNADDFVSPGRQVRLQSTTVQDNKTSETVAIAAESSAPQARSEQGPAKKRRGRPRKTQPEAGVTSDVEKPKRTRSRPRKAASEASSGADLAPKKKRGRPRKNAAPLSK